MSAVETLLLFRFLSPACFISCESQSNCLRSEPVPGHTKDSEVWKYLFHSFKLWQSHKLCIWTCQSWRCFDLTEVRRDGPQALSTSVNVTVLLQTTPHHSRDHYHSSVGGCCSVSVLDSMFVSLGLMKRHTILHFCPMEAFLMAYVHCKHQFTSGTLRWINSAFW